MDPVAGFRPDTARTILEVVNYLKQNGFVLPAGRRVSQTIEPTTPIYVRNDSGEEIPPFACMQSTGTVEAGDQNYITVDKPTDTTGDGGPYLFNGNLAIPAAGQGDNYGIGHDGPVCRMLTDGTSASAGDAFDPVIDSWAIAPGSGTFRLIGADDIGTGVYWGQIAPPPDNCLVYTASGVDARVGTLPGSATLTVYQINPDTSALESAGVTREVFNISATAIPAFCYAIAHRIQHTGQWVIEPPAVTDLRLNGNDLELRRNCEWTPWHTGEDCDDAIPSSGV